MKPQLEDLSTNSTKLDQLKEKKLKTGRELLTDDRVAYILAEISLNPIQSSAKLAEKANCSQSSVLNLFKAEKFHPYKLRCVQPLYGK